jgi:IS30 family transposase
MGTVYTQLSLQERRRIEDWWLAKVPVAEMVRVLKCCRSTIFRELKRTPFSETANLLLTRSS